MSKDNNERQLTEYEKYCQMMAQQQEGVFVRGH